MAHSQISGYWYTVFALSYVILTTGQSAVMAQEYDVIYKKYSNEQAVFTSVKEQLVIDNEKGILVAHSNISREKMLIGELSPGIFNKEFIYYSSFNKLLDFDAGASIYENNGYRKLNKFTSKTIIGIGV